MAEPHLTKLYEDLDRANKALLSVLVDAVKCEQAEGQPQYVISEWAMDKVRAAMKAIVERK